jgi:DNA-binding CsgD family transcriptional regulator
MLFGRSSECAQLEQLLAEARAGQSGTLLLRGEAGIGKSALCDYAAERADGMTVLRARGVQTESELAFSGLADALRPVLEWLSEIPEGQSVALAAALAVGPPVSVERFTICAATLSLLAAAAEEAPVLVVVDEAQWIDVSSTEALLFAARRLDSDHVALLFAVRDGHPTLFDRAELAELRPAALERQAALALLESKLETVIAPQVVERLLVAAAGNPLALVEIPASLRDTQLNGTEPLDDGLPTAATVERAFLRQVESLPQESREALLVAAASDTGELDTLSQALTALGFGPRALEAAEESALVSVASGRLEFRHPLLRAAVYRAGSSVARRAAHQALAHAVNDEQADRRAWHLAAAAPERNDEAAAALEETAVAARRRGGHAESARAFERAALLSAESQERARRLREAASDAWLVGRIDHAHDLLDAALTSAGDARTRARIQHLRGVIDMWQGSPMAAHALLLEESSRIEELDPARAARMLTDAAWACVIAAEFTVGRRTGERACEVAAQDGGHAETLAKAVLGIALVLNGEAQQAVPLFDDYLKFLESIELSSSALYQPFRPDGQVLMWFEQYDRARDVLTRSAESARAAGALGALPYALSTLGDLDFRTGNWVTAYANATEAVRIASETHQTTTLAFSLASLARIEGAQGREDESRAHAAQALTLASPRVGAVIGLSAAALGLLELGLGRPDEAIGHLEKLATEVAEHGLAEPGAIQWAPDLIESYVRVGATDEAKSALGDFERLASSTERTWALAAAARCRGILAPDADFEIEFEHALELHELTPTPFERARTELCRGERLRRAKRRAEAREPLRRALETFERLGAAPWGERARSELSATGETVKRRDPYATDELTPQELQVALIVGRGATNKEAGAALFLSPKTIETHLGRIYRKLNVRSRTELAHRLGSTDALSAV